jgi:molecular chaperone GrpE
VEQEKNDITKFANSTLICSLLPVLDDFERAFAAIPPEQAEAGWADGMKLILRKLQTLLQTQGVTCIEAAGKPFDPSVHEAIAQQNGEEGIVVQEVQKGYMYKDKVLRPSMVVVGNGQETADQNGEE